MGGEGGESGAGGTEGWHSSCLLLPLLMSPLMLSGAAGGAREKGLVLRGGECGDGSVHGGLGSGGRRVNCWGRAGNVCVLEHPWVLLLNVLAYCMSCFLFTYFFNVFL